MGYYIRVLGTSDPDIHIDELIAELTANGLTAAFDLDFDEREDHWTVIGVANSEGEELVQIERNPVIEGELGKDELEEFREDIKYDKPQSAVEWLDQFFNKVKVIYAMQLLDASMEETNSPIVEVIHTTLRNKTQGISQADGEGFSNEQGHHILWQFTDDVDGECEMAVQDDSGTWINFVMDLNDLQQREEFRNGKVPGQAKKL